MGRQFKGEYLRFMQPCLALKVGQRRILELTAPSLEDSPRDREKYVIEFDYPLTIFLGFAISVAVIHGALLA
jgi:hypothetical protein